MSVSHPDTQTNRLLNAQDLAEQTGMSVSSIYRKRSLGESLPRALKIGSLVRWTQESVDQWITEQMEEA